MVTNSHRNAKIRHIGLRRKRQQTKGSCAESKENGVVTNSHKNAKKNPKYHKMVHSLTHYLQKAHFLLTQQESKTRGQGGKGTHHYSFGNAFIRTYSFFRNAYIHTYSFFEIHIISSTIFAAARHELGRR